MQESLINYKAGLIKQAVDLMWRQWSSIGLAGYGELKSNIVIDPEALLLFSTVFARYDARLFDEILDWLNINGSFINIQRLQNILKQYQLGDKKVIGAISAFISGGSSYALKWKKLASAAHIKKSEKLFIMSGGKALPLTGRNDTVFKKYGLLRGNIRLRAYSKPFPQQGLNSLLLRLRALFGISARCETILILASNGEVSPSEAARESCYYQRTIQNILVEMTCSGIVKARKDRNEKKYALASGHLDSILFHDSEKPHWINWPSLLKGLEIIINGLIALKIDEKKDGLLLSSELRQLMIKALPFFETAGMNNVVSDHKSYKGESYIPIFFRDFRKIFPC